MLLPALLLLLACAGDKPGDDTDSPADSADTTESGDSGDTTESGDSGDSGESGHTGDSAETGDTGDTGGPLPGTLGGRRVGYLLVRDEQLDDPGFPTDAQIRRLTHLNVAFFTIREGEGGYTVAHDYDDAKLRAMLTRVRAQANRYGVSMLASVGGWAYGNPTAEGFCDYVDAAATESSRAAFAANAKAALDGMCDNGGAPCFDGFDLDVEYIGQTVDAGAGCTDGGGTVAQLPDFERARDFRDLLAALRPQFSQLTIAGPGALYSLKFSWSVMGDIAETVDAINIMAYDYTGVWTQTYDSLDTSQAGCGADTHQCWGCGAVLPQAVTDHHSPLHASDGAPGNYNFLCDSGEALEGDVVCDPWGSGTLDWSSDAGEAVCVNPYVLAADRVVDFYVHGIGVPPEKLVLGLGFYGRAFQHVGPAGSGDAPGARHGLRQYFEDMCLNEAYCWGEAGIPEGSCRTTAGVVDCPGEAPWNWLTGFSFDSVTPDPRTVTWAQIAATCPEAAELDGVESMSGEESVACSSPGWVARYDDVAEVPWLEHAEDGLVVSFDNPRSARAKGEWVATNGLGGLMFWELAQDDAEGRMSQAVYDVMIDARMAVCP